jgi:hypothetical protein
VLGKLKLALRAVLHLRVDELWGVVSAIKLLANPLFKPAFFGADSSLRDALRFAVARGKRWSSARFSRFLTVRRTAQFFARGRESFRLVQFVLFKNRAKISVC